MEKKRGNQEGIVKNYVMHISFFDLIADWIWGNINLDLRKSVDCVQQCILISKIGNYSLFKILKKSPE